MTLLVSVGEWSVPHWVEAFRRALPGRSVVDAADAFRPDAIRYVAAWQPVRGSLARLPNLRAIFSLGAGVDHLMGDPDLPDLPVVRVATDDLTRRMSEWVVLHCLAILRQYDRYGRQQAVGVWEDDRDQPAAAEVRVGIMGIGVLGQDAALKLRTMGFDVAGWGRSAKSVPGLPVFAGAAGLDAFLARTDILVALLPLTPETRGLLNAALFRRLARDGRLGGPFLLNAGRGGLQVEADVVAALVDGALKGAVLDVFETEPLPENSALWTAPNLTITPHNAAMSAPDATARYIGEQIARMEAGLPPENVVDRHAGY